MAKDDAAVPSSPLDDLRFALAEADFALAAVDAPGMRSLKRFVKNLNKPPS